VFQYTTNCCCWLSLVEGRSKASWRQNHTFDEYLTSKTMRKVGVVAEEMHTVVAVVVVVHFWVVRQSSMKLEAGVIRHRKRMVWWVTLNHPHRRKKRKKRRAALWLSEEEESSYHSSETRNCKEQHRMMTMMMMQHRMMLMYVGRGTQEHKVTRVWLIPWASQEWEGWSHYSDSATREIAI
jgi:hypothetical protein